MKTRSNRAVFVFLLWLLLAALVALLFVLVLQ